MKNGKDGNSLAHAPHKYAEMAEAMLPAWKPSRGILHNEKQFAVGQVYATLALYGEVKRIRELLEQNS